MSKVYQIVTDRIVQALEAGTVPWQKSWAGTAGLARNLKSGKVYRGVNAWLTNLMPFESPFWLTYKQSQAIGGNVRKGEKSTPLVFWKQWETKDKRTGDDIKLPVLRFYSAFNVEQCDGLGDKVPQPEPPRNPDFTPIERCEAVADTYLKHGPRLEIAGTQPSYSPTIDQVTMPSPTRFNTGEDYYNVLFHELTHSTGHQSRLNRKTVTESQLFGGYNYGCEELVAEMGAAFLSAECRVDALSIQENQSAYIAGWLRTIKRDSKLVVTAAAQAQKAADLILGCQWEDQQ
ncbi:unnamed protein product [marine sediment metagenome]|uniref:DUF1738 domain-containing protein n=1 Tax=marine sediment metagenome TaxID=412755 RepID=X0T8S2_9ZZZZ